MSGAHGTVRRVAGSTVGQVLGAGGLIWLQQEASPNEEQMAPVTSYLFL